MNKLSQLCLMIVVGATPAFASVDLAEVIDPQSVPVMDALEQEPTSAQASDQQAQPSNDSMIFLSEEQSLNLEEAEEVIEKDGKAVVWISRPLATIELPGFTTLDGSPVMIRVFQQVQFIDGRLREDLPRGHGWGY